jgi:predicted MFS family arabinose efflux permease
MGVSENYIGYIFALGAFTYAIASGLVGILFKNVNRKYITLLAFIIAIVALLLFGPSLILHFK